MKLMRSILKQISKQANDIRLHAEQVAAEVRVKRASAQPLDNDVSSFLKNRG